MDPAERGESTMTSRWFRSGGRDHDRLRRDAFDPIVEGARYQLSAEVATAIWERVCRETADHFGEPDEVRARERFHEVATRVEKREEQPQRAPGKTTLVEAEMSGNRRGQPQRAPGKTTLVEAEIFGRGPGDDVFASVAPGKRTLVEVESLLAKLSSRGHVQARESSTGRSGDQVDAGATLGGSTPWQTHDDAASAGERGAVPDAVVRLVSQAAAALRVPEAAVRMDRYAEERTEAHDTSAVMAGGAILLHPRRFDPEGPDALRIVTHELVHVAQRNVAPCDADTSDQDAEREAHVLADKALAGRPEPARVRLTTAEAAHDETQAPASSPAPPPSTFTAERWLGVSLEMTPAIAPGDPAIVGMQLQFHLRRGQRPGVTAIVGQWQLTYPSGRVDWSPSLEVVRVPITEAGAYVMRATLIVEHDGGGRQEVPIERRFAAVSAASRAQAQLPGLADNSYEELRGPLDIQHALLRPPGPAAQASGDYRIDTAAANPAAATDRGPPLVYSIARVASTPAPASQSYHWYARPLTRETLPRHRSGTRALGNLRPATLDGQVGFFDLGTGATAELVSNEHNVFVIVCRVLDGTGQRVSEARYVQTVLDERERRDLGELESYLDRSAALAEVLSPATRTPLTAIHVAIDSATTTRLQLFAGPMEHGIAIIDVTPGLDPKQHQLEYEGATFADALDSFRARNHHARGSIRLRVPEDNHLGANGAAIAPAEHTIETTGETQLETWSGRLGLASMGLLAGAMLAAPFTGGSSVAVTLLLIGSAASGAAAAGLSLAERLQHAEISKTGVALDIVGVVTSMVGGAAAFRGLRAANQAINIAGRTSRFVLWTNFASASVAAVLVSVESVEQIQQILGDDKITPDQRRLLLIRVVTGMAMTGAVVAMSYHDLGHTRIRLSDQLGAKLEGALSHEARLTLSLLDDDVLHAMRGPGTQPTTIAEVNRLVTIVRAAPALVRRLAGRLNLVDALRLARHDTADALELGFLRLRLERAVGKAQAERIASALERAGVAGAVAHDLGDPALLRISSDPERAAALYHQHGDRFLAGIQAHPHDTLDAIAGRLGAASPHAAGDGVFELANTRTLTVTGTGGATSTTVDGNLGPSNLNQDLRGLAGKSRAHGATVAFDNRAKGAVHTTGRVTVADARGAPVTIDLEVRATSNLNTPGGPAGSEPVDLQLLPPDPAAGQAHWQAKITLSNRLQRADVGFAVGREIDEAIEIALGNRHRSVKADQQALAFRPGGRMVTSAAQTTAADRATLQQLQGLWADLNKQKQALARQQRIERTQRLLRQMGLDDPERFARRLPLLRSMGMTEAEWKPLQVMIEQRAFATARHPGLTATHPVIKDDLINHLLHPGPRTGRDFILNGLYGGHQTANLKQFVNDHPNYEVVQVRSMSSGGTMYREYRQYRWKATTTPPPIGDPHRPGGAAFGPSEQAMWDTANVPKTTADNLQPYLREAEAAWEQWRSSGYNPGPPPFGAAVTADAFTTSPNTAGVAFEGGFKFNAGPPPTWQLHTIYPKL